uniref:MS153 n=1 Tax=Microscilla sp. PRE1 TaxID=155537 RepID=Q93P78_9BACT|nr:metallophosphoesterase [Microscilla sp. PRE1]AAK62875.1 MS153 [Microscilla sp. PRE1]
MKIQHASDLHLEFPQNRAYLDAHPIRQKADILLLAGDTNYLTETLEKDVFFLSALRDFKHVYLVPGNHEFYKQSFDIAQALRFEQRVTENCTYLNNRSINVGDVRIIFTTLWTHIEEHRYQAVQMRMNDFHQSMFAGGRFTAADFVSCHAYCKNYLETELQKEFSGKTIVVSHHVPYPPEYAKYDWEKSVPDAYHVDLIDLINEYEIDHWIHGHNHWNIDSFQIGKTWIHTNQLGYVFNNQHFTFSLDRTITI